MNGTQIRIQASNPRTGLATTGPSRDSRLDDKRPYLP